MHELLIELTTVRKLIVLAMAFVVDYINLGSGHTIASTWFYHHRTFIFPHFLRYTYEVVKLLSEQIHENLLL